MGNKSSKNLPGSTFTWKLPNLTATEIDLLCKTFIANCTEHLYMPDDIISLCIQYFNDDVPMESILHCKPGDTWKSDIFNINQFRFFIEVFPNGYDQESAGYVDLLLSILSIPPHINRIKLKYNISLLETSTSYSMNAEFSRRLLGYAWDCKLKFERLSALQNLTFLLNIKSMKIYYLHDKLLSVSADEADEVDSEQEEDGKTEKLPAKSIRIRSDFALPSDEYTWNLTEEQLEKRDSTASEAISSPVFAIASFKWMLEICKMTDGLDGILLSLVSLSSSIWTVAIYWQINIQQTLKPPKSESDENEAKSADDDEKSDSDQKKTQIVELKKEGTAELHSSSLYHVLCPHLVTEQLQSAVLALKITIIDVFDDDGVSLDQTANPFQSNATPNATQSQSEYVWKVNDIGSLRQMKTCAVGSMFVSPCFMFNRCHWCLRFYPNGYDKEDVDDDPNVSRPACLMLNCVATPPDIDSISIIFELTLNETNTHGLEHQTFHRDSFWGWEHVNVDILPHDMLTMTAKITVVEVYNQEGQPIVAESEKHGVGDDEKKMDEAKICKEITMAKRRFVWRIEDEQSLRDIREHRKGAIVMSPIFEMFKDLKWYLEIHPLCNEDTNGNEEKKNDDEDAAVMDARYPQTFHLFLSLATVSPKIESVAFAFGVHLKETNSDYWHYGQLFGEELSIGTDEASPKQSVLKTLDSLTFELTVGLTQVYDTDGNLITQQFFDKDEQHENDGEEEEEKKEAAVVMAKEVEFGYGDYVWKIDDSKLMKKIKKAKHFQSFSSDIFSIKGFKFMMQICPNGSHLDNKGVFEWFLCLVSIPPSIYKVSVIYKVHLLELGVSDYYRMELSLRCTSYGWGVHKVKMKEIQKLKQLTFDLHVAVIDVYHNDGHSVLHQDVMKSEKNVLMKKPYLLQECQWRVRDKELLQQMKACKNMQSFKSETFGNVHDAFKWNLFFYPNGAKKKSKGESILYLSLQALPSEVSGVSIYFELYVKETNTQWSYCTHLRQDKLCEGWETCRIKLRDVMSLKKLTFAAVISLIDVYDMESNLVTHKYVQVFGAVCNEGLA